MAEMIMVRHGATSANIARTYCGCLDPPLDPSAIGAVKDTARLLSVWQPGCIYCSEALRARQTAEIIAPGCQIVYLPSLREMDFGTFEGLDADTISNQMPEEWQAYMNDYMNFTFPDGDSVRDYLTNTIETYNAIFRNTTDERILVVSHKGFILSILSYLLHNDIKHIFSYDIRPAGFARLTVIGSSAVLKQLI